MKPSIQSTKRACKALASLCFLALCITLGFSAHAQKGNATYLKVVIKDNKGVEFPGFVLNDGNYGASDALHFFTVKNDDGIPPQIISPQQLQQYIAYEGSTPVLYVTIPARGQQADGRLVFAKSLYQGNDVELLYYYDPATAGDYVVKKAGQFYYLNDRSAYASNAAALEAVVSDCPALIILNPLDEVEYSHKKLMALFREYNRCEDLNPYPSRYFGVNAGLQAEAAQLGTYRLINNKERGTVPGLAGPMLGLSMGYYLKSGKAFWLADLNTQTHFMLSDPNVLTDGVATPFRLQSLGLQMQWLYFPAGYTQETTRSTFKGWGLTYKNYGFRQQNHLNYMAAMFGDATLPDTFNYAVQEVGIQGVLGLQVKRGKWQQFYRLHAGASVLHQAGSFGPIAPGLRVGLAGSFLYSR